ncbi:MAG: DUF4266 domain-containing protein [Deltaproteobacteria bacterium]|nr:DUF4266 domain-containing protein [Deltaproteobacteria bacterium]
MLLVASALLAGCATVRPEDREFLAEPAMSFSARSREAAMDEHILQNREGSMGGGTAGGGGCGCN